MFSSKFWFTLVTLIMGGAIALLLLARNSYNAAREDDTRRLLLKDRDQAWALLKAESRVRLDVLLRVTADQDVLTRLAKASADPAKVTSDDRAALSSVLQAQNKALGDYAGDLLIAVDGGAKAIAHVWEGGPDKVGYHLGGFPAVRAALRGYMQDDVWAVSTDTANPDQVKVYRIATRPVISAGRYVGAVVHGQQLDSEFASTISKRLGARVVFFRGPVVIAAGAPEGGDDASLLAQSVASPLATLLDDERFLDSGRSDILSVQDDALAVYALAMGEASLVDGSNVGYAIVRSVPRISSSMDIITAASLEEWTALASSNTGITLISAVVVVLILGFVFFSLEHGRPVRKLRREVNRLASREVDRLNVYAVSRLYRSTAESINKAMDKAVSDVAEKLGKKPASIDSILGPQEPSARVSSALFTFPDGGDEVPPPPPGPPPVVAPPPAPPAPPAPAPMFGAPPPPVAPTASGPPPFVPPPRAPFAPPAVSPVAAPAPGSVPGPSAMPAPPAPGGPGPLKNVPSLYEDEESDGDDEDKTEIAGVPEELLIASRGDSGPGAADEATYFRKIFEQFVSTKEQCGERTDNLQYERFTQTLRRNRDALVERYGCKSVRFQVYVKDGKAALKATPVKS